MPNGHGRLLGAAKELVAAKRKQTHRKGCSGATGIFGPRAQRRRGRRQRQSATVDTGIQSAMSLEAQTCHERGSPPASGNEVLIYTKLIWYVDPSCTLPHHKTKQNKSIDFEGLNQASFYDPRRCPVTQTFWDPPPGGSSRGQALFALSLSVCIKLVQKFSGCAGHLGHFGTQGSPEWAGTQPPKI